ncbi:MAG: HD domain-containing protein [Elusimicrobia bacterium]|nr:HD domain-containing protein [Elusimicrobiota bacterium]
MTMTSFYFLAFLCGALMTALWVILQKLYTLKIRTATIPVAPLRAEPASYFEELRGLLSALQDYPISQSDTASREDFCKLLIEKVRRLTEADRGLVLLWDADLCTLRVGAGVGYGPVEPSKEAWHRDDLVNAVFASGRTELRQGAGGRLTAVLPLAAKSSPSGVLRLEGIRASEETCRLLLPILAGEAAAVLYHLNLFDHLQTFHIEMVETLYRTVNAGDSRASTHAEETRSRARRLAKAMKLPEPVVRHVEYAALLRGVGKIGVDQAILNKPGKLTNEEYEKIKKYTTIGHELLKRVKLLAPAAKMVLHHQEWFDGRGYPEGLRGEHIPLGARIIAVISAWEAMRTDRPYRKALEPEAAIAELARAAGTQFDPAVVEAFRQIEEERRFEDRARPGGDTPAPRPLGPR